MGAKPARLCHARFCGTPVNRAIYAFDPMNWLVYMTTRSRDEALLLARLLTARKLCAGVNILPGAYSVYWWEGALRVKEECLLFAQVSGENREKFIAVASEAHPYQTPCIICLPIDAGHEPFLEWIQKNGQDGA